MSEFFKVVWRFLKSIELRRYNISVSPFSRFNKATIFEGNNVIAKNTIVSNSIIGRNTYIGENSNLPNCKIGRFCSLSSGVTVVDNTHPSSIYVSTCPSFFSTLNQNGQSFVNSETFNEHLRVGEYSIVIGNDVWIGTNAIIKGGVSVGDGAIIAMGAVVTKNVPPFSIVGGVPAKIIKYRFDEQQIKELMQIQWWNKSDDWLKQHISFFNNIDVFLNNI